MFEMKERKSGCGRLSCLPSRQHRGEKSAVGHRSEARLSHAQPLHGDFFVLHNFEMREEISTSSLPWILRGSSSDVNLLLLIVQTSFLLVVFQIDDVLAQETPAKGEAAAQSIKIDLSLAYKKMLSCIHPQDLKLPHWVLFVTRPLRLQEPRFAFAIEEGMTDSDTKRQLPFPSFIDWALGLLVVDSQLGEDTA
jgi:hypothetical protein